MMLVDCHTCPVRDVHCADCMVTALTVVPLRPGAAGPTTGPTTGITTGPTTGTHRSGRDRVRHGAEEGVTAPLDRAERRAVSAFLAAGLVTTATANAARAELDPADLRPIDLVPVDVRPGAPGSTHRTRRAV